jgi:formate dehydrogenase iron-sulfur subunit
MKAPTPDHPPRGVAREPTGFFTDVTLCIGCKACEVACKEWNEIPADGFTWSGLSYDHTRSLSGSTWRHVKFVEQRQPLGAQTLDVDEPFRWVFFSDVCKHCAHAGCLEVCPTGAILRNEFGAVYVQPDVCNGCGYCVVACPFGVIGRRPGDGRAFKCTLCYDRQLADLTPACAKACPTEAIRFGPLAALEAAAEDRLRQVRARGHADAVLYTGAGTSVGRVHAQALLLGDPRSYGLPIAPESPLVNLRPAWRAAAGAALMIAAVVALAFRA